MRSVAVCAPEPGKKKATCRIVSSRSTARAWVAATSPFQLSQLNSANRSARRTCCAKVTMIDPGNPRDRPVECHRNALGRGELDIPSGTDALGATGREQLERVAVKVGRRPPPGISLDSDPLRIAMVEELRQVLLITREFPFTDCSPPDRSAVVAVVAPPVSPLRSERQLEVKFAAAVRYAPAILRNPVVRT